MDTTLSGSATAVIQVVQPRFEPPKRDHRVSSGPPKDFESSDVASITRKQAESVVSSNYWLERPFGQSRKFVLQNQTFTIGNRRSHSGCSG